MNDFISPILKLLSTLVSARAAVRYVLVGFTLVYSWVKIKPIIDPYGLPSQISGIACTFIGIGTGTLAASLLFQIADLIINSRKMAREKKKKEDQIQQEQALIEEQEQSFFQTFKDNIVHLDQHAIKILRTLCKRNASFTTDNNLADTYQIIALQGLYKNNFILKVMSINSKENVYTVNPLLKDWLVIYLHEKLTSHCNEYLNNLSPSRAKALELLEDNGSEDLMFPQDLAITNYHYYPCIECNSTLDIEQSFYFEFREDYREIFEEVTGKKYKDYVEVYYGI